jgi:hypothetical protein
MDEKPNPGDAIADTLAQNPDTGERQVAVRDVAHEIIQAGAEQELTPRLAAEEHAEPFTDADYAAYEEAAAAGEAPPEDSEPA